MNFNILRLTLVLFRAQLAFAAPHVDNLKVLYKLATVFPGPNLPPLTSHVTLGAGHYEYPFEFKASLREKGVRSTN